MNEHKFVNICLEGGGVKGISYLGALSVLQERNILQNIKRVSGTSAGAITAALLAVGYTPEEMLYEMKKTPFSKFCDKSWFPKDLYDLYNNFGFFKGDFFESWMESLIEKKTGDKHYSFKDLGLDVLNERKGFKNLYIISTNLSENKIEVLGKFPNKIKHISRAVRASMSIPLFFQAVLYKGEYFADGGMYKNYPIDIFDNISYVCDKENGYLNTNYYTKKGNIFNCESLGIRVDSKKEILLHENNKIINGNEITDFKSYLTAIIFGYQDYANRMHLHKNDWARTMHIEIDSDIVGTTDFDLKDKQIEYLLKQGRKGAEKYLEWFDNSTDAINKF